MILMCMLLLIFGLTIASFYITEVPSASDGELKDRKGGVILTGGHHTKFDTRDENNQVRKHAKREYEVVLGAPVCVDDLLNSAVYFEMEMIVDTTSVFFYSRFNVEYVSGSIHPDVSPPGGRSSSRMGEYLSEHTILRIPVDSPDRVADYLSQSQTRMALREQRRAARDSTPLRVEGFITQIYAMAAEIESSRTCTQWFIVNGFLADIPSIAYEQLLGGVDFGGVNPERGVTDDGKSVYCGSKLTDEEKKALEEATAFFTWLLDSGGKRNGNPQGSYDEDGRPIITGAIRDYVVGVDSTAS